MIALDAGLALLLVIGWCAAGAGASPGESAATRAVRGAVWAFTALVIALEALGACGHLRPPAALGALAIAAAGALAARRAWPPPATDGPREPWTPAAAALAAATGAALAERLWAGLHRTSFLYDTLSYHLHAPATWMHAARLEVVPAVFGDPAPAYAPANLELWFWFLMAPLRSDYLAGTGQWPFAALAVLAVAATVRELGAGRAAALGAGLAFLLCPEVWTQSPTAMVDVGLAAFFLAALPFAVRAARTAHARDAAALGLAAGLAAGTKAIGLVFAAPLAMTAVVLVVLIAMSARRRGLSRPSGAAGAAIVAAAALAAGGFWPLRSAVLTGNPAYPLAVRAGGRVLLDGLYDAAAMRAWDYHVPIADVAALGRMLLDAGIGFVLGAAIAFARVRRPPWALAGAALVALFWLAIPYQESRFLFPLFGVAAIAMGQAAAAGGPIAWGPLALALAGGLSALPAPAALAIACGAALGALARAAGRRLPARGRAALVAAGALAALAAAPAGLAHHRARDPGYAVGDGLDEAWSWFHAHVRGARVAYSGVNLAFPLRGADLANDVRYVNVAGRPSDVLHDFPPSARDGGAEPAPYRQGARYETWLDNLRAARTEVLFVAPLYPIVQRSIDHDADGFPVERAWADAHPGVFRLRHATPAARVYAIGGETEQ